ncbi:MAG: MerR family transcriptional regulator [Lachnospiraceae bacterium]|nr:MerR family transcriptional regulator [Lachnospiraceae bacterium]
MMTVNEVSRLSGVTIRTLQYYDKIGLLKPAEYTESGYRLYDDTALEKLQQILLFKELEFPLKEIKEITESSDFDRNKALKQQIELLTLKKEHLEKLIDFARGLYRKGGKTMDFSAFDTSRIDEYAKKAKEQWGSTPEYMEYEKKTAGRSKEDQAAITNEFMKIFECFGSIRDSDPASKEAQELVKKLKDFISEHYYTCSDEVLLGLGKGYAAGGEFTENIDKAGGKGTAIFTDKAIRIFCKK